MDLYQIKTKLNNKAELVFKKLGMKCEVFTDNIYSVCPIHEASDNPRAFSYSINKGIWKCWTRDCQYQYKNDIFGLITGVLSSQTGTQLEFKDTLKWCCDFLNIKRHYNNVPLHQDINDEEDGFADLVSILNEKQLIHNDAPINIDNNIMYPSEYFYNRGFKKSTLKYFNVGDCHEQGIMKERAIIPIHNDSGKHMVGTICRSIKEYRMPKFLILPKGFDKRFYLYNYHRAIDTAIKTSCLFILEGQGDVWRMYEAGVKNAVSIFGKVLTQEQQNKLLQLPITHLIILTDNDQAGRESKVQIKRQLGRMYKLTFPKLYNKDIGDMTIKQIRETILHNLQGTY